jgi:hypothetical protein
VKIETFIMKSAMITARTAGNDFFQWHFGAARLILSDGGLSIYNISFLKTKKIIIPSTSKTLMAIDDQRWKIAFIRQFDNLYQGEWR